MAQTAARRARNGAVLVEAAIVFPVVFFIFLGTVEIARGLMAIHLLNHAAQVGCRSGIIEGQSTANIKTVVVSALTPVGINAETVTVQVNDGNADASTTKSGDEITVLVQVPVSAVTWVPFPKFLSGGTLRGQYTMRRE